MQLLPNLYGRGLESVHSHENNSKFVGKVEGEAKDGLMVYTRGYEEYDLHTLVAHRYTLDQFCHFFSSTGRGQKKNN